MAIVLDWAPTTIRVLDQMDYESVESLAHIEQEEDKSNNLHIK
jgi:hypothetical protein